MKLDYFPGCSLKSYAKELEKYSLALAEKLGIKMDEIENWNCCGVLFPMAKDDIMRKIGVARNILKAKSEKIVTICPMCYNVMKRGHRFLKENKDANERAMKYLKDEGFEKYRDVEILLFPQVILEAIKERKEKARSAEAQANIKSQNKSQNRKVAAYYGCTPLRPEEVAIDDPEDPSILEELLSEFGYQAVDWWMKNECCGAYHAATKEEYVKESIEKIAKEAKDSGADVIATLCPLCYYNLQKQSIIPVEYLSKLLYEGLEGGSAAENR